MNQKELMKQLFNIIILNILGTIIYAIGMQCFAAPHRIAPGGASGAAILVNYVSGFPIGLFVFLFNIPLLFFIVLKGYFSKAFVVKTLLTTGLLSLVTDNLVVLFPVYKGDPLLASMFGGALMGVGLALVHLGRSNTGGISLLGLIIQKKWPQFQVGALISILNLTVVAASGIVFKNIESVLYAVVMVYLSGIFMDRLIEQYVTNSLLIVISEKTQEINNIFLKARKGVTILKGEGGYSHEEKKVVLCASTKADCEAIQLTIKKVDPQALIIVTEASKVIGKGFKHLT